jgi:ribonuclease HI
MGFKATNNEAEYEAVARLMIAQELGGENVEVRSNLRVITSQLGRILSEGKTDEEILAQGKGTSSSV